MTLEEKIGQRVQYSAGNATGPKPKNADFEERIEHGQIGAFLNVIEVDETSHYQHIAIEKTRLHIPLLFGYDVIHGMHEHRAVVPVLPQGVTRVKSRALDSGNRIRIEFRRYVIPVSHNTLLTLNSSSRYLEATLS